MAVQSSPRVAIIGGGLAGIAAAIALSRIKSIDISLFEAKSKLGGRAGSFWDDESQESVDYCQHVGMGCCTNLRWLISELNSNADWSVHKELHFFSANGRHIVQRRSVLPAPLHMWGLLQTWPQLTWRDRWQIAHAMRRLMRMQTSAPELEWIANDWLEHIGQSPNAIRCFWDTIIISALGEQLDRVALGPARQVLLEGFAAHRSASELWVPRKPLSEIFHTDVLRELRNRRINTQVNCRVKCIDVMQSSPHVIFQEGDNQSFDYVICSVPWHQITSLLGIPCPAAENPTEMDTSPITGIHTWWDTDWLGESHGEATRQHIPHAILIDRVCHWIFPKPEPLLEQHYYQIVISSSRDIRCRQNSDVQSLLREDLKDIFPAITTASLRRSKVVTDPRAVFSVSPSAEYQRWNVERFADKSLFVAGDWTATGWPATMEGAIRSGFLAAANIARRLDQTIDLPRPGLKPSLLYKLMSILPT